VTQRFPVSTYIGVVIVRGSGPGLVRTRTVTPHSGAKPSNIQLQAILGSPSQANLMTIKARISDSQFSEVACSLTCLDSRTIT